MVPFPDGDEVPERLMAYCGEVIAAGQAELVDKLGCGMPCEMCLVKAPIPGLDEGLPPAGGCSV
jgi:hypothetical protein